MKILFLQNYPNSLKLMLKTMRNINSFPSKKSCNFIKKQLTGAGAEPNFTGAGNCAPIDCYDFMAGESNVSCYNFNREVTGSQV